MNYKNVRYLFSIVLVSSLLLCFGCSSSNSTQDVDYEQLVVTSYSPTIADSVQIFITNRPDGKYTEMGILKYLTYKYNPDNQKIHKLFQKKAAEKGADAIIIMETTNETYTNYATKQTYQGKVFRAMAIKYK